MNIFDIITETNNRLQLQSQINNMNLMNTTTILNEDENITISQNMTTTTLPSSTCLSDIVDAFASALAIVTADLDPALKIPQFYNNYCQP